MLETPSRTISCEDRYTYLITFIIGGIMTKLNDAELNELVKHISLLQYPEHDIEEFRQIKYRGKYLPYLVSSYGRVFSTNYKRWTFEPAEISIAIKKTGYCEVCLSLKGHKYWVLVHRLVATAFIENTFDKEEVNHINGIKTENYVWNLEWVTRVENDTHAREHGLKVPRHGEDIGNNKFTESDVIAVCHLLSDNVLTLKEISKETGVTYDMVRNIRNHNSWTHISKNYAIDNYTGGKDSETYEEKLERVHSICKDISTGDISLTSIAKKYNTGFSLIWAIFNGSTWKNVSKDYDFSNYNPKKFKKKK